MSTRSPLRVGALLALVLAAPAYARQIDPAYLNLLRDGQLEQDRGDHAAAVRSLRLGCFGLLDDPKMLAEGLARLAISQAALGDPAGFETTFSRLIDLEERFQAYSTATIAGPVRQAFEEQVAKLVPPDSLIRSATFAHLVPVGPPLTAKTAERRANAERQRKGPKPLSAKDALALAEAQRLFEAAQTLEQLESAWLMAKRIADQHPGHPEPQFLAGRIAFRASRWNETLAYLRRGGDPGDDDPDLLFYLAVALFETGAPEEAAATLRRCLPSLRRTRFVDSYVERILGQKS